MLARVEDVEDERRRDLIRQIAGDGERLAGARGGRGIVDSERVRLDDLQVGAAGEAPPGTVIMSRSRSTAITRPLLVATVAVLGERAPEPAPISMTQSSAARTVAATIRLVDALVDEEVLAQDFLAGSRTC